MNGLITENEYAAAMQGTVLPALHACRADGTFTGAGGKELHYAQFTAQSPRGTAVILHGFTESIEKFHELIWFFLENGLNVCVYEQRGHGSSYRAVRDTTLTHVERFEEYVDDLDAFTRTVAAKSAAPHYLFAHSMGGAVAALYLERGGDFYRSAVLSSPMIAPARGGIPLWLAKAMCRFFILIGKSRARIFLSQPYPGREEFAESSATSQARFNYYEAIKSTHPEFQNYSPTYRWTYESLRVTKKILMKGAVERIKPPVTVFSAALDTTVLEKPQRQFAARLKHGTFRTVADAKHEIFRSADEVLNPYLEQIIHQFQ